MPVRKEQRRGLSSSPRLASRTEKSLASFRVFLLLTQREGSGEDALLTGAWPHAQSWLSCGLVP